MNIAPTALRDAKLGELPLFFVEVDAGTEYASAAAVFAKDQDAAYELGLRMVFEEHEECWQTADVYQLTFNPNNPFALDWDAIPAKTYENPNPKTYRHD